jgi:hypothetical protein
MPESIGSFTPSAVIEAIETSLMDSSAALGRSEDGIVFRGSDVTWVYTGTPALSRVLGARFTSGDVQDRVLEILNYFKSWDASVSWVVGPSSYPPKLGDYLHASGFGIGETWLGMAMDLSHLPVATKQSASALDIQLVSDDEGLRAWATLRAGLADDSQEAAYVFSPENAGGDARSRYYLGYLDGRPVSRAMSFRRGDVVGLYWLDTILEHRGKGYRAAMVRRAMQDAAASSAKALVMAAPIGGQSFCEQLGFKLYCQFNVYSWPPARTTSPLC